MKSAQEQITRYIARTLEKQGIPKRIKKNILRCIDKFYNYDPYYTDKFDCLGLENFYVGKNVLRPDESWVSIDLARFLSENVFLYKGKMILDMGSGSGIQGILCAIKGADKIFLVDIENDSIETIRKNIAILNLTNVKFKKSDLFDCFKNGRKKFDVVIFNHPFFPEEPIDAASRIVFSGRHLISKFFQQVSNHIFEKSIIIMPFSCFGSRLNNPLTYAKKYDYHYLIKGLKNKNGKHFICIMSQCSQTIDSIKEKLKQEENHDF